jgi:hypothetical protein
LRATCDELPLARHVKAGKRLRVWVALDQQCSAPAARARSINLPSSTGPIPLPISSGSTNNAMSSGGSARSRTETPTAELGTLAFRNEWRRPGRSLWRRIPPPRPQCRTRATAQKKAPAADQPNANAFSHAGAQLAAVRVVALHEWQKRSRRAMSDSATVGRIVRVVRPGGRRRKAREVAAGGFLMDAGPGT